LFVRGFVSRAIPGLSGIHEPASAENRRNSSPRSKIARPRYALHECSGLDSAPPFFGRRAAARLRRRRVAMALRSVAWLPGACALASAGAGLVAAWTAQIELLARHGGEERTRALERELGRAARAFGGTTARALAAVVAVALILLLAGAED